MPEIVTGEWGLRETAPVVLGNGRVLVVYERMYNSILTMSLPTSWPGGYDDSY